jgi:hypothetical protein
VADATKYVANYSAFPADFARNAIKNALEAWFEASKSPAARSATIGGCPKTASTLGKCVAAGRFFDGFSCA